MIAAKNNYGIVLQYTVFILYIYIYGKNYNRKNTFTKA